MGVVITRDDIIAYAEVDYIIHHMNEKYINKVPEKLLNFFATIKDPNHVVKIDPRIPLQNQNLKKYTLELIALLHIKYWCEDEERRRMLYEKMLENQRKLDSQMREKYNINNMFDMSAVNANSQENSSNHQSAYSSENSVQKPVSNNIYSTPKGVTQYAATAVPSQNVEDNDNVQENKINSYVGIENDKLNDLKRQEQSIMEKSGFFMDVISKIKNVFLKFKR